MEIISTVLALVGIAECVLNIREKLSKKEKRKEAADWLNQIAELLNSVIEDLKQVQYPHDKCMEMNFYLQRMAEILSTHLNEKELQDLQQLLEQAYKVEAMFGDYSRLSDEEKAVNIQKLEETVGIFRGSASILRLS